MNRHPFSLRLTLSSLIPLLGTVSGCDDVADRDDDEELAAPDTGFEDPESEAMEIIPSASEMDTTPDLTQLPPMPRLEDYQADTPPMWAPPGSSPDETSSLPEARPEAANRVRGYPDTDHIWTTSPIPVCFEDVTSENYEARRLIEIILKNSWEAMSGVRFVFKYVEDCDWLEDGLHVEFSDEKPNVRGLGTELDGKVWGIELNRTFEEWGYSGKDCRGRDFEYCMRRQTIHEFGHALGWAHEHKREDDNCAEANDGDSDGTHYFGPVGKKTTMTYCGSRRAISPSVWDGRMAREYYGPRKANPMFVYPNGGLGKVVASSAGQLFSRDTSGRVFHHVLEQGDAAPYAVDYRAYYIGYGAEDILAGENSLYASLSSNGAFLRWNGTRMSWSVLASGPGLKGTTYQLSRAPGGVERIYALGPNKAWVNLYLPDEGRWQNIWGAGIQQLVPGRNGAIYGTNSCGANNSYTCIWRYEPSPDNRVVDWKFTGYWSGPPTSAQLVSDHEGTLYFLSPDRKTILEYVGGSSWKNLQTGGAGAPYIENIVAGVDTVYAKPIGAPYMEWVDSAYPEYSTDPAPRAWPHRFEHVRRDKWIPYLTPRSNVTKDDIVFVNGATQGQRAVVYVDWGSQGSTNISFFAPGSDRM